MTINEAFEKSFGDIKEHIGSNTYSRMYAAWQASAHHYEREMAELEGEVAKLKDVICMISKYNTELQANNHDLREALEEAMNDNSGWYHKVKQALSTTPAESLQARDDEVLERAANELEKEEEYGYYHACIVRSLKEVK